MTPLVKRRQKGLYGRKTGVSEVGSQIQLADYLVNPFPVDESPVDFTHGLKDYGMAMNDKLGCCGVAGDYHKNMIDALTAGLAALPVPDDGTTVADEIGSTYLQYDHGQDEGVDLGQWLLWRCSNGLAGLPPIGGFAMVSDNGAEYAGAFKAFGGLYVGILVNSEMEDEFEEELPWTSTNTDWVGGHCGVHAARNASYGRCITWGADQLFTWANWRATREEAYVILTPEMMNTPSGEFNNVNVAQLKQDIQKLQGVVGLPQG